MDYNDANSYDELSNLLRKGFSSTKVKQSRPTDSHKEESPKVYETKDNLDIKLPVKEHIEFKQHKKTVSSFDLDKSGTRLASGSHDYTVAIWDFPAMDQSFQPFRFVEVLSGSPVRFVRYNPSGEFLVTGAGHTTRLLDRNGKLLTEFYKGDPYIRDMKRTIGHVGAVLSADWNPQKSKDQFITSGQDGTIRFWNSDGGKNCQGVITLKSNKPGQKTPGINQAMFTLDGRGIICGTTDGSIRIYPSSSPWVNPTGELSNVHGSDITSIAIDHTGNLLCTRAMDDTLKLWDLRSLSTPLGTVKGLPTIHEETGCIFSPDGRIVATATSKVRNGANSTISFFDTTNLSPVHNITTTDDSSVVSLAWHSSLNQIFAGTTSGSISIYYDLQTSQKGILLPLSKLPTTASTQAVIDTSMPANIYTPISLPLFRNKSERNIKKMKLKARQDPIKSHRPELPVEGPGVGGRIGSSVTQSIMKNIIRDTSRDEDPREALLKFAEISERDPKFVTPAYLETQPTPILDVKLLEHEVSEKERKEKEDEKAKLLAKKLQQINKN